MTDKVSITKTALGKVLANGNTREHLIGVLHGELDWFINNFQRSEKMFAQIEENLDLIAAIDEVSNAIKGNDHA